MGRAFHHDHCFDVGRKHPANLPNDFKRIARTYDCCRGESGCLFRLMAGLARTQRLDSTASFLSFPLSCISFTQTQNTRDRTMTPRFCKLPYLMAGILRSPLQWSREKSSDGGWSMPTRPPLSLFVCSGWTLWVALPQSPRLSFLWSPIYRHLAKTIQPTTTNKSRSTEWFNVPNRQSRVTKSAQPFVALSIRLPSYERQLVPWRQITCLF